MYCSGQEFAGLAREITRHGSSLRFEVRGGSMYPSVRDGDTLLVGGLDSCAPRLGDVVLCMRTETRLAVHRVVRRRWRDGQERYLVKGDRSPTPDGWLPCEAIVGRVVAIERNGRMMRLDGLLGRVAGHVAAVLSPLNLWQGTLFAGAERLAGRMASSRRSLRGGPQ
jgi:signal peptidase I